MSSPITADEWADIYGALKPSGPGAASAWLGIPLTVGALVGMLWTLPVPVVLRDASPAINGATLFLMASFVYYCILSIRLALGGLVFLIATAIPGAVLAQVRLPLMPWAAVVFAAAFAWQLIETWRGTRRMRIVRNLQYIMLGPIWLMRAAYRRFGLAY